MIIAGCEGNPALQDSKVRKSQYVPCQFEPASVEITPLTELVPGQSAQHPSSVKVYVAVIDQFKCQVKIPGVFRFEVYQYQPRSPVEKGQRLAIWPDINLTDPVENNNHWRDFLRVYEFNFDFDADSSQTYILQATCLVGENKRLTAECQLKKK